MDDATNAPQEPIVDTTPAPAPAAPDVVQDDSAALSDALAGYHSRGSLNDPPERSKPSEPETKAPEAQAQQDAMTEVAALKEQIKALSDAGGSKDEVRRLYGEIGNITRTLKQMQAEPRQAPVSQELTAAMAEAERVASEYPELAQPLVKALKALESARVVAPAPDIQEQINTAVTKQRQQDAIEALSEEHPDWRTVRGTPEFRTWLTNKPTDYQQRLANTWNPAVVSRAISEFKGAQQAAKTNADRLARAVKPTGTAQRPAPSVLPDEQGFIDGYNSVRKFGVSR